MQLVDSLAQVDPAQWNALAAAAVAKPQAQPFLRHEWLHALERTGCVGGDSGWIAQHLIATDEGGALAGAVPLYAKLHSYGEYVFDWAWAQAYERAGLSYYPKLVSAVPFTPVCGARLLARPGLAHTELAGALIQAARTLSMSSLHVLFPQEGQIEPLAQAGLSIRRGTQFHWHNRGYADFEAFLAALSQPKRKKIRAERRKVREAGVTIARIDGPSIEDDDWRFFVRCYRATYAAHHSTPYLNLAFFREIGRLLPEHLVMTVASRGGARIAATLLVVDETRLYGRYWGALEQIPCLHFELAYYQSIEAAIEHGLAIVEGGAQGEHKLARGFEPVVTASAHWLAHPAFARAVDDFLAREEAAIEGYLDELGERSPFKLSDPASVQPPPSDFIRSTE
jgi:uncharacterized protein